MRCYTLQRAGWVSSIIAGTAASGCGSGAHEAVSESPVQRAAPIVAAPAAVEQPKAERKGVTLKEAGAEPRRVLRFAPAAGATGLMKFQQSYRQTVTAGGKPEHLMLDATEIGTNEWAIDSVSGDAFKLRARPMGAPRLTKLEGDADTVAEWRERFASLRLEGWVTRSYGGRGDETLDSSDAAVKAEVTVNPDGSGAASVETGGAEFVPFLPMGAVGVGAVWVLDVQGENESRRVEFRLVSLSNTAAEIEFQGQTFASSQASSFATSGIGSQFFGTCKWAPGLPDWAESDVQGRVRSLHLLQRRDFGTQVVMDGQHRTIRTTTVR